MKEKMNGVLKFLNHASYMYESNDFIFICDPWLEGAAFNNGWHLLDQSTSNDDLLSYLVAKKKACMYLVFARAFRPLRSAFSQKIVKNRDSDAICFSNH
jgi:hypothetical protein